MTTETAPRATYTLPRGYLSPSQVTRFLSCPACYQCEYLLKLPKAVSVNLPLGSGLHKGIEWMRLQRISGQRVKVGELVDVAVEHYESETSQPIDVESGTELIIDLGSTYRSLDQAKDKVADLVRFAAPQIAALDDARGGVAAVELDLVNFPSPYPFEFHGRVDALYGASIEAASGLEDLKSSKDRFKSPDTDAAIQLTLYSEYFPRIPVVADVVSKTSPPELHSWNLIADDAARAQLHQLVLDVAEDITAGRFRPSPSWRCGWAHGFADFKS